MLLRRGLTWQLIASRLNVRYLPEGYILDSGAPCAFLKPEVDDSELWFILGWLNTDLCSHLLKTVINHTKNIQSKDVERLPYPFWVSACAKEQAIHLAQAIVEAMRRKQTHRTYEYQAHLESLYAWQDALPQAVDTSAMSGSFMPKTQRLRRDQPPQQTQLALWHE